MSLPEPIGPKAVKLLERLHRLKMPETACTKQISAELGISIEDAEDTHNAYHIIQKKGVKKNEVNHSQGKP